MLGRTAKMSRNVHRSYRELHDDVEGWVPGFSVPLRVGQASEFPEQRNMAYCAYKDTPYGAKDIVIVVAPKLARGPEGRIQAILRHELAHAIEFHLGEYKLLEALPELPAGPERRADRLAELLWGDPIYYDDILVQTLDGGKRPRPRHLGL